MALVRVTSREGRVLEVGAFVITPRESIGAITPAARKAFSEVLGLCCPDWPQADREEWVDVEIKVLASNPSAPALSTTIGSRLVTAFVTEHLFVVKVITERTVDGWPGQGW